MTRDWGQRGEQRILFAIISTKKLVVVFMQECRSRDFERPFTARMQNADLGPYDETVLTQVQQFVLKILTQGKDQTDCSADDVFLGIVESSLEGDGWNLYSAGYYRDTDGPSTSGVSYKDRGFVIEAGKWVSKHFEVYSCYDITMPDSDRTPEDEDFSTLTGGFSFYPRPHTNNFKTSTELLYRFDAEAESIVGPNVNSSVRASPAGDQWVFRTQGSLRW